MRVGVRVGERVTMEEKPLFGAFVCVHDGFDSRDPHVTHTVLPQLFVSPSSAASSSSSWCTKSMIIGVDSLLLALQKFGNVRLVQPFRIEIAFGQFHLESAPKQVCMATPRDL